MSIMVSFPFGVMPAVDLSASTLMSLSQSAVEFIQTENIKPLAKLMKEHQVPLLHQNHAVRQLAAGMGIAYPDRVDAAKVDRANDLISILMFRQGMIDATVSQILAILPPMTGEMEDSHRKEFEDYEGSVGQEVQEPNRRLVSFAPQKYEPPK
jgi:hypothetical protein